MFGARSARSLIENRIAELLTQLQGVRDGSADAIHDARVATRRSREALVAAEGAFDGDQLAAVADTLRRAGRALGRVRDADVMHELLLNLDATLPIAAPAVSHLRTTVARERLDGRRRVIKDLERLDLPAVLQQLRRARRHAGGWGLGLRPWRATLREHLIGRSAAVRTAVLHGSGVYFPNRSHATRIAVKKLRYAVELSEELRLWRAPKALRRLKRAQETLGRIRDRQVLIERLGQDAAAQSGAEPTIRFLDAEVMTLQETYAGMRERILESCACIEEAVRPRHRAAGALAAVALPSLFLLGRQTRRGPAATQQENPEDVRVRVHVQSR